MIKLKEMASANLLGCDFKIVPHPMNEYTEGKETLRLIFSKAGKGTFRDIEPKFFEQKHPDAQVRTIKDFYREFEFYLKSIGRA
jgi:hypothetical protein